MSDLVNQIDEAVQFEHITSQHHGAELFWELV